MEDKILQITLESRKQPKTKFGRWWENKISYPFYSFKLKIKAWFFGGLYRLMLAMMSKEKREQIQKEDREILVKIVNETGDERFTEHLKESLKNDFEVEEDIVPEAVKKAIADLNKEL
jgi:hypothetical protein